MKTTDILERLEAWEKELRNAKPKPKTENTITTYRTAVNNFYKFLQAEGIEQATETSLQAYKDALLKDKEAGRLKVSTINIRIIAINKFLKETGETCSVSIEDNPNNGFNENTLNENEYKRLLKWADKLGMKREALIMETLANTGIRINELQFFTVEALEADKDKVIVKNKGKTRPVVVPDFIRIKLLKYAKKQGITSGVIFRSSWQSKNGGMIDKSLIWKNLKKIAGQARIKKTKVHAHSFRHLFATSYLNKFPDNIAGLAELLGHSSLETTRLYLQKSAKEHKQDINNLYN